MMTMTDDDDDDHDYNTIQYKSTLVRKNSGSLYSSGS